MADTIYQQLREHLHYLGLRAVADRLARRPRTRRTGQARLHPVPGRPVRQRSPRGRAAPAPRPAAVRQAPRAQDHRAVRLRRPTRPRPAPRRRPRHAAIHRRQGQRLAPRPARSWFTLPSSRRQLSKQSSVGGGNLDPSPLRRPWVTWIARELAALDLVQHGLAGDAEQPGRPRRARRSRRARRARSGARTSSVRRIRHGACGVVCSPGSRPSLQPAADRGRRDAELARRPARSSRSRCRGRAAGRRGCRRAGGRARRAPR